MYERLGSQIAWKPWLYCLSCFWCFQSSLFDVNALSKLLHVSIVLWCVLDVKSTLQQYTLFHCPGWGATACTGLHPGESGCPWAGPTKIFTMRILHPQRIFKKVNATPLKFWKVTPAPQHPSSTQQYSSTAVQQYSSTVVQQCSSTPLVQLAFYLHPSQIFFLPDMEVHPNRYLVHRGAPRWKWWPSPRQWDRMQ